MAKKIKYESAKYHLLISAREYCDKQNDIKLHDQIKRLILSFEFSYEGKDKIKLSWEYPTPGMKYIDISSMQFYTKNDQYNSSFLISDNVYQTNKKLFDLIIKDIIEETVIVEK